MRPLLALTTISLLAVLAGGCDEGQQPNMTGTGASRVSERRTDPTAALRRERSDSEGNAIVALVDDYYATAANDDGARACRMLYSITEETIVHDYGHPPGPPSLRGNTCATVMSKLFKHAPGQPPNALARTVVTDVRVNGRHGYALLTSPTMPSGEIPVQREHAVWKVNALIGRECNDCAVDTTATSRKAMSPRTVSKAELTSEEALDPTTAPMFSGSRHSDTTDGDRDPGSYDDDEIIDYGHAADAVDRRAIETVVRDYYQATATKNYARACTLLYSLVADSLPENYGLGTIRAGAQATCESTLAGLLAPVHRRLVADAAAFKVAGVRVDGKLAYVLLNFRFGNVPYTVVHREGSTWRVVRTLDTRLP